MKDELQGLTREFGDPGLQEFEKDSFPEFAHDMTLDTRSEIAPRQEFGDCEEGVDPEHPVIREYPDVVPEPESDEAAEKTDKRRRSLLLKIAAASAGALMIATSFGIDFLGDNLLFGKKAPEESVEESKAPTLAELAHIFPKLPNRERNRTNVPEDYISINTASGDSYWIHINPAMGETAAALEPGLSYDAATNTLTMENYHGRSIYPNIMGNGFTIRLVGTNTIDCLQAYGFFYGGSITITGSGTLIIGSPDTDFNFGIMLDGEQSSTCLMIERTAHVEVYGKTAAIIVCNTDTQCGVYYESPLEPLTGEGYTAAEQRVGYYGLSIQKMGEACSDFTFYVVSPIYEDGTPAKHLIFGAVGN